MTSCTNRQPIKKMNYVLGRICVWWEWNVCNVRTCSSTAITATSDGLLHCHIKHYCIDIQRPTCHAWWPCTLCCCCFVCVWFVVAIMKVDQKKMRIVDNNNRYAIFAAVTFFYFVGKGSNYLAWIFFLFICFTETTRSKGAKSYMKQFFILSGIQLAFITTIIKQMRLIMWVVVLARAA